MNHNQPLECRRAIELRGLPHPLLTAVAGAAVGIGAAFAPRELAYAGAALTAGVAWILVLLRWRSAFLAALAYLPFSGVVILALSPSRVALLFKDLLFLAPAYALFVYGFVSGRESLRGLPCALLGFLCALAALVVLQMLNPHLPNPLVALIGLKVWLFYIPVMFLAFAFVAQERDLRVLLRLLVTLTVIPCLVGLIELALVLSTGYRSTMESIYGDAAIQVTQRFAQFEVGEEAVIARIPSTFTFVTQYFGFTLAMIVPAYALMRLDPTAHWRHFAAAVLVLDVLACLTSGARGAFVYLPLLMTLIVLLDRRAGAIIFGGAPAVALAAGAVMLLGMDLSLLFDMVFGLGGTYASEIAYGALTSAICQWPLGEGTGVNTGPARYAFSDMASFEALENYYAKAVHELGLPGLIAVMGLFLSLIVAGFRVRGALSDPRLRSVAAALLAFLITMSINCFKGWQLDLDPINVYLWLFAGMLLKLAGLDNASAKLS
jgi:hypothetical protein